jgi:hypothetical protein
MKEEMTKPNDNTGKQKLLIIACMHGEGVLKRGLKSVLQLFQWWRRVMKKALLYVATAIFMGTVTMVVPLMLLKPRYYELIISPSVKNMSAISETLDEREFLATSDKEIETFEEGGVLERAVSPSNLSSAGLMLIPSFLLAFGVSLYLKKRMRT